MAREATRASRVACATSGKSLGRSFSFVVFLVGSASQPRSGSLHLKQNHYPVLFRRCPRVGGVTASEPTQVSVALERRECWVHIEADPSSCFSGFKEPVSGLFPLFPLFLFRPTFGIAQECRATRAWLCSSNFQLPDPIFGEEVTGETAGLIRADISSFEMLNLLDGTSLALM